MWFVTFAKTAVIAIVLRICATSPSKIVEG
jgi:hypothetical protein